MLTTTHLKNISCYEPFTKKAWDLDYTLVRPKQRKRDVRFVTWNVRSLYRAGSLTVAATELARYKLVCVQNVRWNKEAR